MALGDSLELFPGPRAPQLRAPLAERMRPQSLDEVVGQEALVGRQGALRRLLQAGQLPSMILWGPPGSGKTTLARILAEALPRARWTALSAVTSGVKELRQVVERAERERAAGYASVLFLDEIHRFNRAQQDALLPHVERGTLTLIGATTENPSFEVIPPLLSRCRVFTLEALSRDGLLTLLRRSLEEPERGVGATSLRAEPETLEAIAAAADGDARRALGLLEGGAALAAADADAGLLTLTHVSQAAGRAVLRHDRDRDAHYDVVSALIKSLRASDPDAAIYYAARMLEAGEDPRFVARRLVIFASEDVGNAEPAALPLAIAAYQAVERIGLPEARINLAQAVTFLACAPKSNASYRAIEEALAAAQEFGSVPIPLHLRNAPTGLMRGLGHGRDYRYPHDEPGRFVADRNLPRELGDVHFYRPTEEGAEKALHDRLRDWRERRARTERHRDRGES